MEVQLTILWLNSDSIHNTPMASVTTSKITIHMVCSLDGFIARKDNNVSWFETTDHYEKGIEFKEQQTKEFLKTIDCYVMGARTYEHAAELSKTYGWAYGDVPTVVTSHKHMQLIRPDIELYSGDLDKLVDERLKPNYKNIWVVGGASLVKDFIQSKLADKIRLSILPIILGDGIPFFNMIKQEHQLHLENVTAYKNGMVELAYEIKKE
jgi:dihydrofolate reductase